eukprot:CAMPEP_0185850068 /NCGR_PEP_ID=MMETSP1354-20130828/4342_1 /TAXON_ID=708628 /ORGANISM="Erythrolobus madagascarensis, Strain CCMP3276" /LENGTH=715 /DNA_ID=CAMNT_0028550701 /DNA_START=131 /DNA_END=2278 /DNA_ORIENTATION=+
MSAHLSSEVRERLAAVKRRNGGDDAGKRNETFVMHGAALDNKVLRLRAGESAFNRYPTYVEFRAACLAIDLSEITNSTNKTVAGETIQTVSTPTARSPSDSNAQNRSRAADSAPQKNAKEARKNPESAVVSNGVSLYVGTANKENNKAAENNASQTSVSSGDGSGTRSGRSQAARSKSNQAPISCELKLEQTKSREESIMKTGSEETSPSRVLAMVAQLDSNSRQTSSETDRHEGKKDVNTSPSHDRALVAPAKSNNDEKSSANRTRTTHTETTSSSTSIQANTAAAQPKTRASESRQKNAKQVASQATLTKPSDSNASGSCSTRNALKLVEAVVHTKLALYRAESRRGKELRRQVADVQRLLADLKHPENNTGSTDPEDDELFVQLSREIRMKKEKYVALIRFGRSAELNQSLDGSVVLRESRRESRRLSVEPTMKPDVPHTSGPMLAQPAEADCSQDATKRAYLKRKSVSYAKPQMTPDWSRVQSKTQTKLETAYIAGSASSSRRPSFAGSESNTPARMSTGGADSGVSRRPSGITSEAGSSRRASYAQRQDDLAGRSVSSVSQKLGPTSERHSIMQSNNSVSGRDERLPAPASRRPTAVSTRAQTGVQQQVPRASFGGSAQPRTTMDPRNRSSLSGGRSHLQPETVGRASLQSGARSTTMTGLLQANDLQTKTKVALSRIRPPATSSATASAASAAGPSASTRRLASHEPAL